MCSGGGGSVSKASISDPLAKNNTYKKAREQIKTAEKKHQKGKITTAERDRRVAEANDRIAKAGKYADPSASAVEANVGFMVDKIGQMLDKNSTLNLTQELVNASSLGLQQTLDSLNQFASMAAENQRLLQEDAARLSALKGAPLPEPSATAPVIGRNRSPDGLRISGRRGLRIDLNTP